jgi:acyl-CoA reductase-like NAD-dependent aldehyde dehydrogenase
MLNPKTTDLQDAADTPESVAEILRRAADKYREAPGELASAWQDPNAGKVWAKLARAIENCAASCERIAKVN